MFSDTFAGIAPTSALPYIGAQVVGAALAFASVKLLVPSPRPVPATR
jgi:glycerol uptake facilitator-like aquaporin